MASAILTIFPNKVLGVDPEIVINPMKCIRSKSDIISVSLLGYENRVTTDI